MSGRNARNTGMRYQFVNVCGAASINADLDVGPRNRVHGSGDLAPGTYASSIVNLPASQTADGRSLARGFFAVLWPMDDLTPEEPPVPRYFGPFSCARRASEFIRESLSCRVAAFASCLQENTHAAGFASPLDRQRQGLG